MKPDNRMPPGKHSPFTRSRLNRFGFLFILTLLLVKAFSSPTPTITIQANATQDATIEITPGSSVRREVTPGATEEFGIAAGRGQLLRFSLDKGDLALSTVLYDPSGKKLLERVSHDFEVINLSFAVDVTGIYKISVQSCEKGGPQRAYELKIETLTSITPLGRQESEAQLMLARAASLRAEWTEQSLRQAIAKYDRAALIFSGIGNLSSASNATLRSGDINFLLGEYSESLKRYQLAATQAVKAADSLTKAKALIRMGRVYSYIGNNDLAQKVLSEGLNLLNPCESNSNPLIRNACGLALSNLAEVHYAKGDLLKASELFESARVILFDDRDSEAKVHLFKAYLHGSMGEPLKAKPEIIQALDLYRSINNKGGEGLALTALGLYQSLKTDDDGAIDLHKQAIAIFQAIGARHSEGIALNALGQVHEKLKEYAIAFDYYEKALKLFQNIGALDLVPVSTFKLAKMQRSMGNLEVSLTYYNQSLKQSRAAKKVRTEINALNEMASIYASMGRTDEALKQYQRVQEFYSSMGDRRGEALVLNTQGDFFLSLGQKELALKTFARALQFSEKAGDNDILIATLYSLSRAQRDRGKLNDALAYIERSLQLIEDLRTNVGSPEFRATYFSAFRKHFDLCIDILMQLEKEQRGKGYSARALIVSEKSRARSLVDLLSESHPASGTGPTELIERESALRGMIRAMAQYEYELSLTKTDSTQVEAVAKELTRLRSEYQEVQRLLRQQRPQVASLADSVPQTVEQIQSVLRDGQTMLLEYSLGEERSYLWAVTLDSFQSYELPPRKVIEDGAIEIYSLMTARQLVNTEIAGDYRSTIAESDRLFIEKATNLSQVLLGPVATQLGQQRLLLVTEGALQYLPFEALPVPLAQNENRSPSGVLPLLKTNEIVESPSIATLIAIRAEQNSKRSPDRVVAVIADPVFSRSDERLGSRAASPAMVQAASDQTSPGPSLRGSDGKGRPARLTHASEEANAISAAAPRGSAFVARDFEASRETAMSSRIGEYQIVHFATHGFLDSQHPELSSIVLTMVDQNGDEKNGLMPLYDISSLRLSAELTVLSACQTALGKDVKGEGLIGLTNSFISAGSKSVIASLWKVDDRATAALMGQLYASMLQEGKPPATALRLAKLKVMQEKQWSAPYFWAGFVLQGEYTNRITVARNSWVRPALVLISLVTLLLVGLILVHRRRRLSLPSAPHRSNAR